MTKIVLVDYDYIKKIDFSSDMEIDVKNLLLFNNRGKVYDHVNAVANKNMQIAKQYHLDQNQAKAAGLLHDISVVINPNDMLAYAKTKKLVY